MAGNWDAVAKAVDGRLSELSMPLRELSRKAQVGESTVRELRYNTARRHRHPSTLTRLSVALNWSPDHLYRVLIGVAAPGSSGGTPAASGEASLHQRVDRLESLLLEVLTLVRELHGRGDRDADR